jgi:hypothetical protein
MSAETDLRALLAGTAGVTALVSTRIAADRIEQGVARPFVVYSRTASDPLVSIDGAHLKTMATLEVSCWGDTRASADAVADAVTTAVRGQLTQSVVGRNAAYDETLDAEGTVLIVNWWE